MATYWKKMEKLSRTSSSLMSNDLCLACFFENNVQATPPLTSVCLIGLLYLPLDSLWEAARAPF